LLNQEHSLPEQIDEAAFFSELLYRFLKAGNSAAGDAKHVEKLVVEGLTLASLGGRSSIPRQNGSPVL
jgi:hypothetical protein